MLRRTPRFQTNTHPICMVPMSISANSEGFGQDCVRTSCIRSRQDRLALSASLKGDLRMSLSNHPWPLQTIAAPSSKLTQEISEFVRDNETELLFNHSSRVYYFAALAGVRRNLVFDRELLYAGAMFHDLGLMPKFSSPENRFEVDGANAARNFLQQRGIDAVDIAHVWAGIALHTTPGIPQYMHPVTALVTAGVEMDVLGIDYDKVSDPDRNAIVQRYPRPPKFKEDIIQAFYDGIKHKPETTFGNVKADVLVYKDPTFKPGNFCSVIRNSSWRE
jgi:HD superfamily phosphodiesterase